MWLSVWSKVQFLFAYGPDDATVHPKTPLSLASFKCRLVLPFWYWLTRVVLAKRLLNGCSVVVVVVVVVVVGTSPTNLP